MNKGIILLVVVSFSLSHWIYCQEKSSSIYIVPTIGGLRTGNVTREWLLSQKVISLNKMPFIDSDNNFTKLKLDGNAKEINGNIVKYYFDIMNYSNTYHSNMVYLTDSITNDCKKIISKKDMGLWVYFTPVFVNYIGDTISMQPIKFKIKN